MKVAVLESLGISRQEMEKREAPFKAQGVDFAEYDRTSDADMLVQEAADAEAMIVANMPLSNEVISRCPKLRFIDVAFTGTDHVGLDAAKKAGVKISNASGYSDESVAELALEMTLSLLRKVPQTEDRCRNGGTKEGLVGSELCGKTVGIIGLGKIGRRSAALYHAFAAEVIVHNRSIHDDFPDYIRQVSLEELLETADIVVLHCPQTPETIGMINAERIALMKKSAILINVARGPVVVSQDLADALNAGQIAGAGIDVFDQEPPLSESEPLLHAKHTLLTPHIAFATRESMIKRADIVFDNLQAWMDGQQKNIVL